MAKLVRYDSTRCLINRMTSSYINTFCLLKYVATFLSDAEAIFWLRIILIKPNLKSTSINEFLRELYMRIIIKDVFSIYRLCHHCAN